MDQKPNAKQPRISIIPAFSAVIINLFTFLILAMLVEGLIYVGLTHPSLVPGFLLKSFRQYYQSQDRSIIQVTGCGQYDPELFYIMKQGACTFENREFSVRNEFNSVGLRDDESSLSQPEIIVMGDSYAAGWGVGQNESFPALLERLSGQKVLNAGVSSYGTARQLLLLNRIPERSARSIVWQYHANDYAENIKYLESQAQLPVRNLQSYDSLKQSVNNRARYYPFKHLYGIAKGIAVQFRPAAETPTPVEEARIYLEVLKTKPTLLGNARLVVFKIDDFDKLDDQFANAIDSLVRIPVLQNVNITALRISDILSEDDYFVLDDHINIKGHAKIASKINREIFNNQ